MEGHMSKNPRVHEISRNLDLLRMYPDTSSCRNCGQPNKDRGHFSNLHRHKSRNIVVDKNMAPVCNIHDSRGREISGEGLANARHSLATKYSFSLLGWSRWRWGQSLWTVFCILVVLLLLEHQAVLVESVPAGYKSQYHGRHIDGNYGHYSVADDEEYDDPEDFRSRGRQVKDTDYLIMFGYLPQSDFETGAMRTEEEMGRAIRRFQQYANLPLTGKLDEKTRSQMSQPRCGLPDIIPTKRDSSRRRSRRGQVAEVDVEKMDLNGHRLRHHHSRSRRYALSDSKWDHKMLTFRILNHTPDLSQAEVRRAIYRALKLWSDVTYLTFSERVSGDADMMIRFAHGYHGDGYSFDGPGLILAHAFFPGVDRGGDVHFDDDEKWTAGTTDGTNLFIVAAHEIGHALGLSHSSVPGSLMFPWYQGYQEHYKLTNDDIMGIQYLYGAKYIPPEASTLRPGERPPAQTSRPGYPVTTLSTTTLLPDTPPWTTTTLLPTPPTGDVEPDSCSAVLDAISIIRGELFAFSGNWFWRANQSGVMDGYPANIHRFWYGFPSELNRIDAVLEQYGHDKIFFFRGNRFWKFNSNTRVPNFPKEGLPLTELGLPPDLEKLDAAFQWGHNQMIYFISGFNYWRYNQNEGKVEAGYPRDMSMWSGVPVPVGAAFQFWDGRTYFFQGTQTWCFNDIRMSVRATFPKLTGEVFLDCKREVTRGFVATSPLGGGQTLLKPHLLHIIVSLVITILYMAS